MASHRRASRLTFAVLAAVAVVATGAVVMKSLGNEPVQAEPLRPDAPGPTLAAAGVVVAAPVAQLEQQPAVVTLTLRDDPAGTPSTRPSTRPIGDATTILSQAAVRREAGDIVTARNLVNDGLAAGVFGESELTAAKAFVGELNDRIIFGTQKFPADAFNREWRVEPGTARLRLCRRFDVTAELLCKVNGLSSPNRLRAGVTIKAIQGPFHLVVSKSKFEADIYLGAPGGEGSMYVKTVRVGLGSDGSTPTGVWEVGTGKVTNPVYYSPRGEGVIGADDPANPLGERWIPLTGVEGDCVGKESYGIHGTIDPSSIGKNMSMGCIRLLDPDVVLVYDLLVEGKSRVRVVD